MSSEKLTIVAKIWAKDDKRDFVKSELLKLIATTRTEEGCMNYDLHQDHENPNLFLFFENWRSRDLWQQHMKNSHITAYKEATEGTVEKFTLNEMTQIG